MCIYVLYIDNTYREDYKERRKIRQKYTNPGIIVNLNCHPIKKNKNFKIVFNFSLFITLF